jgi:hypothetical protein
MSYLEFTELYQRGELYVGVDVFKALAPARIAALPWQVFLESRRFRRFTMTSLAVWTVAPFMGIAQNLFVFVGALAVQMLIHFFIIGETLFDEALLNAFFFSWAVRNKVIILFLAD